MKLTALTHLAYLCRYIARTGSGHPRIPRPIFFGFFGLTACSLILLGCGYHRTEPANAVPDRLRNIYIAPLANRSNELMLASWITDELRQEFLRDAFFNLTPRQEADVILEGRVKSVFSGGLSYSSYDNAIERSIRVTCSLKMLDAHTGKLLWQTSDITREEAFLVATDLMGTQALKDQALKKVSRDVAELVHHRIADLF